MFPGFLRHGLAAQHARELLDALSAASGVSAAEVDSPLLLLFARRCCASCRDLRQVRDGHHRMRWLQRSQQRRWRSAVAPPMPTSTLPKITVGVVERLATITCIAVLMRDSSPPEAMRASGPGSAPVLVATRIDLLGAGR
ncbi:MAG: hypothetical protein IPF57_09710 [Gammaproteobacteria bacterium]|nr:hypothetical protein [Gammaproteobacteria bacterium]